MSESKIAEATNDVATKSSVVSEDNTLQDPVGGMYSSDPVQKVDLAGSDPLKEFAPPPFTVPDLMKQFVKIGGYTLAGTDTALTVVAGATSVDVWSLYLAVASVVKKFANYSMIKSSLQIRVVATFPGGSYGCYVIAFAPYALPGQVTASTRPSMLNPLQSMNGDYFVMINGGTSEDAEVCLPFLYPYDFANLPAGPSGSWFMNIHCIAPVATAVPSGATVANLTVYARLCEDAEFNTMMYQGKMVKSGRGPISSMLNNAVGTVGTVLAGVEMVQDIASSFGFTKERDVENPKPTTIKGVSSTANIDGYDSSRVAALSGSNHVSTDPKINSLSTDADELSYAALFDRYTVIAQYTWSQATAAGTSLGNFLVAPMYCRSTHPNFSLTTGGYVGLPFQYWRGTMEYMVIITASELHRGAIQVAYMAKNGAAYGGTDVTNVTYNKVVDVTGSMVLHFRVGYADTKPALINVLLYDAMTGKPDYYNGSIELVIVNPLRSQNTAANCLITVLAKCSSDMQFFAPRDSMPYVGGTNAYVSNPASITSFLTYQGKLEELADNVVTFDLVPVPKPYPVDTVLAGESFNSIRALMQKPMLNTTAKTAGNVTAYPYMGVPNITINIQNTIRFSYLAHYKLLFCCISGSERYKFINNITTGQYAFWSPNYYMYPSTGTHPIAPIMADWNARSDCYACEAIVPYYFNQKWVPSNAAISDGMKRACLHVIDAGVYVTADGNVFNSAADDLRLSVFAYTPQIRIGTPVAPNLT